MLTLFITEKNKTDILDQLKSEHVDIDDFEIVERKKISWLNMKIKVTFDRIKTNWQVFLIKLKSLIQRGGVEPLFGGGGYDPEFIYQLSRFIGTFLIQNISWDIIKFAITKLYKSFNSEKNNYIAIISDARQPFDVRLKILIPNNLDDKTLTHVLDEASHAYTAIDPIRGYFAYNWIIIKFKNNCWHLKFVGKK